MPGAIGFGIILMATAWLVLTHGERPLAGLAPDEFAAVASLGAMLLVVGSGVVHRFRGRWGDGVRALALWIVLGGVLVAGYAYREAAQDVGYRVLGELAPGRPVTGPDGEVMIARRGDGSFAVQARVNGREMRLAFDTGASTVVLGAEGAAALGIRPAVNAYTVTVWTANGRTAAAPVVLDRIAVGDIVEEGVPALVARPGALAGNLLGMTFLERLASYEVRGSRLILRGAAPRAPATGAPRPPRRDA